MKTLSELAEQYGTDKGLVHASAHGYTPHYERFFSRLREEPVKLLEIGVGGGESIRMWLDYFPRGRIHGVDTQHDGGVKSDRYKFNQGDQSCEVFWKCFIADHGPDWDIIVDDGGHFANQVITSFRSLWPHLKPGGIYCIEDLEVAASPGTIFVPAGWQNHMDFVKDLLDGINRNSDASWMYFYKGLMLLCKK